jgi:hypothetical protein
LLSTTGDVYEKASSAYTVVANITGPAGSGGGGGGGGSVWRVGAGAPSNALGIDGDFYLNSTTDDVHTKAAGVYSVTANLRGAAGSNGTNGTNGSAGAGMALPQYKVASTHWQTQAVTGTSLTTAGAAVDRFDLFPAYMKAQTITDLGALVSVGAAGNCKICVYDSDANGLPVNKLFESADMSVSAAAAVSVTGVGLTLTEGQYWLGIRFSAASTMNCHQQYTVPTISCGTTINTSMNKVLRRVLSYATAAPSVWGFTATEATSAAPVAIFWKS